MVPNSARAPSRAVRFKLSQCTAAHFDSCPILSFEAQTFARSEPTPFEAQTSVRAFPGFLRETHCAQTSLLAFPGFLREAQCSATGWSAFARIQVNAHLRRKRSPAANQPPFEAQTSVRALPGFLRETHCAQH